MKHLLYIASRRIMVHTMPDQGLRRELSIMALVCTLGIFLFPSSVGPYSSVHGPVTALRAIRIATDVVQSFQLVSSKTVSRRPKPVFDREAHEPSPVELTAEAPHNLILRC